MFCKIAGVHLAMKRRGRLTALPAEATGTQLSTTRVQDSHWGVTALAGQAYEAQVLHRSIDIAAMQFARHCSYLHIQAS